MSDTLTKLRYPKLGATSFDEIPIGFYMPWEKSMQASIPPWWVEANGQLLNDAESPLNGMYIPNLNGIAKTKDVTFTSGSATATMTTTKDIYAGALVSSSAVPSPTKVLSIDSDTEITMDNEATSTGGISATIGGNGPVFVAGGGGSSGVWRPDQEQGHWHIVRRAEGDGSKLCVSDYTTSDVTQLEAVSSTGTAGDSFVASGIMDDGTNGPPRTGDESYPKHRTVTMVMKVKTSNQTKLITGYTLMGGGYGPTGGVLEVSGDTSIGVTDPEVINATSGATDVLISILNESWVPGQKIKVRKVDSGTGKVTVTDTTNGIEGNNSLVLPSQYNSVELEWSGSFWTIVSIKANYDTGWVANSDWTNAELLVTHGLDTDLSGLIVKFFISTDGTEDSAFEIGDNFRADVDGTSSAEDNFFGWANYQISKNQFKIQTGEDGIVYLKDNGRFENLSDLSSASYKVVVRRVA